MTDLTRRDLLRGAAGGAAVAAVGLVSMPFNDGIDYFPAGEFIPKHAAVVMREGRVFVHRPYSVGFPLSKDAVRHDRYGVLRHMLGLRTDARIERKLRRERGRAARGVLRYQGMRHG